MNRTEEYSWGSDLESQMYWGGYKEIAFQDARRPTKAESFPLMSHLGKLGHKDRDNLPAESSAL